MKKFQIFRYLKKLRFLIVIITLLGSFAIYSYANKNQQYTSRIVIKYTNPTASEGVAPDGSRIDAKEIYSAGVITDVIEDLGLNTNVDQIRSACSVETVISEDEQTRKDAILGAGDEYTGFSPVFRVTFTAGSNYSVGYVRNVLDSIINNYYVFYSKKYVDDSVIPNNTLNVSSDTYDYLSCVELLEDSVNEIVDYLSAKKSLYPNFRSSETGYSFADLQERYEHVRDNLIPQYYAIVLGQQLTRDKDVLLKNYENRYANCIMEIENLNDHIEKQRGIIDQFGDKVTKAESTVAGAVGDNTDAIIENVETSRNVFDADTTYDKLINYYVNLRSQRNQTEIESKYCQYVISIFGADTVVDDESSPTVLNLTDEMSSLIGDLNQLYTSVETTTNELNKYSGAKNIFALTGTYAEQSINVNLYLAMAVVLFFVAGCAGAILIGRISDFWEYLLYTDKKTGTANRVKCDAVIDEYSKKLLDDNFSCIVFKLNRLQNTNDKRGREAGDTMLKRFGTLVNEMAEQYGFVGYNNGDMFFAFFESCSRSRAETFVTKIQHEIDMNDDIYDSNALMFEYGIAESSSSGIYDIRKLLKTAIISIGK